MKHNDMEVGTAVFHEEEKGWWLIIDAEHDDIGPWTVMNLQNMKTERQVRIKDLSKYRAPRGLEQLVGRQVKLKMKWGSTLGGRIQNVTGWLLEVFGEKRWMPSSICIGEEDIAFDQIESIAVDSEPAGDAVSVVRSRV